MPSRLIALTGACLLAWLLPASAAEELAIRLKGELDGIPMHYIDVVSEQHAGVNIQLDGLVKEDAWLRIPAFDNLLTYVPSTGKPAPFKSEIRLLATERGLYVSAVMHQPPETLSRRLTNRDAFVDRDTFGITLDTTGNGTFAYWFIVALGDSLSDGKVLAERRYSNDWDGPWQARTAVIDSGWSVEILLPWSMMSLPKVEGDRRIGFSVSRQVAHANERYQWPGHSQHSPQFVSALNEMSVDGVDSRQQLSVIPYASFTMDEARDTDDAEVGADITWKPSPLLEVTAALNPDFGAVEADDVVLNLTALETFFSEKRLFFLEGNEVFETTNRASFGHSMRMYTAENFSTASRRTFVTDFIPATISLLNTRRIGGSARQTRIPVDRTPNRGERDRPTDLVGAIKLNGSSGRLRYGVLGAFEDDVKWRATDTLGTPTRVTDDGRDFAAARVVLEDSWGSARTSVGYMGTHVRGPAYDASVHGIDGHFSSAGGRWTGDAQLIMSDVADQTGQGVLLDFGYRPDSGNRHTIRLDYFDDQVDINDLGFLLRNDYAGFQYVYTYARGEALGPLLEYRGAITVEQQYSVDAGLLVGSNLYWRNTAVLAGRNTVRTSLGLFRERFEDVDTRGNGAYRVDDRAWWDVLWTTDASRMLSFSLGVGGLQEHLGDWTWQVKAGFTFRPSDRLEADLDVTYRARDGWLVYQGANNFGAYHGADWRPSLSATWFFNAQQQLRFSLQWAGVRVEERGFYAVPERPGSLRPAARTRANHDFSVSLVTAQLRYRWEIAPLTDLFVVYNRGNTLAGVGDEAFDDLFSSSLEDDPIVDALIIKLRYRFAN